ncbi:MAG TPA: M1 family metallopeptidase [Pyrinomonadaceae bacterium]|jgi:aminopeptidase N|nr:M1 family metallopeptidase [Pyrinomonadaceae bacterium]
MRFFVTAAIVCCLSAAASAQAQRGGLTPSVTPAPFDVLHYDARVEPDVINKTIRGRVSIRLVARAGGLGALEFDCGELVIDAVREGAKADRFERAERVVRVFLSRPARAGETREVEFEYHGAPRCGIRFYPERETVYTVFTTSQWMVCVDAPDDRATLRMTLVLPANLANAANGREIARRVLPDGRVAHEWRQDSPVPTYVFGFAAGRFREVTERRGRVRLRYLAEKYTEEELRRAFRETADMIAFYEERSGVPYAGAAYTQVLAPGGIDQEMSGFTVMGEGYGRAVLADERAVWLGAHELSHQWWGIGVTARDWTHFWLNEGVATFIASAYRERRFGREEYMRDIEKYRASYEKVRDAGHDKSLVFQDWIRPTSEDRALVYDKGAYVLHILREEVGERAFWAGLRRYTRKFTGKSVTTPDFQAEMERASGRGLSDFFAKWVYLTRS